MPRVDLTNKSIVITGASSGIGRSTALACARAGMRVVVAARRLDRLEQLAEEIRASGGEAYAFAVDVTDEQACDELIRYTISTLKSCDAVFANAGITLGEPTHAITSATLQEIFDINLFGAMHTLRPAIAHMRERGAGHALLCSSCLALLSVPNHGAYTATKAAQHHLARAMRMELAGTGVYVSSVHPIGTKTELFDAAKAREGDYRAHDTPKYMTQSPERVANAVVKCLRKPKPEVWTSQASRVIAALTNAAPRLTDRIVRAVMPPPAE